MKQFKFKRDDNVEFIFSCCTKSDLVFNTYDATSFPLTETPIAVPSGVHLIPSRGGASSGFLSDISSFSSVINSSDLSGHTFIVDGTRSFTFNAQVSQVTFTIGNNSTTVSLSGYCTLPYCDEFPVAEYPTYSNPYFLWEFNWFGATPDVARIYGSLTCYPEALNVSQTAVILYNFFSGIEPIKDDTDPYSSGGGSSETGGGGGDFNNTSDTVGIPSNPTISATDTGFMTVFATNISGLQSLSNALWSDLFPSTFSGEDLHETAEALKNIVASPYDAILGCHIVPVAVPTGASKSVKLYGVLPFGVSLPVASTQWVTKDCGSLNIKEHWGAYLDYSPYTKVTSLYLPFVGVVSVDIDMIMGKTLGVQYKIDIVSGQCVAFITVNGSVEFQYQGHCAVTLPVTSIDWSNTVSSGLGLIGSVTNIVGSAVGGALAGGVGGAISGGVMGAMGQAGAIAQNVMNSKPDIKSGSGIGGSAGLMACKKPFLIIERPRQSVPKKGSNSQNHWTGYPSNTAQKLGDLTGYTEVSRIFINRTNATAQEKEEIERLLHEGVYL